MRRLLRGAAATVLVLAVGACGKEEAAPVTPDVPAAVVPASIATSGGLTLHPDDDPEVADAFKSGGKDSLVKEGRVWEVRSGDRLVGLLQLASLLPRADTRKEEDRRAIRQQIFPGEPAELDFFGVPVYEAKDGQRSLFLWYGRQVFAVLQLKGVDDAEAAANELITVALQDKRWPGLTFDDFEEA